VLYFGGAIMVLIERSAVEDATEHGHVGRNAQTGCGFAARRPAEPQPVWKSVLRNLGTQTFPPAGVKDEQFLAASPKLFSTLAANTEYRSAGST
jgi:hypothetical protein